MHTETRLTVPANNGTGYLSDLRRRRGPVGGSSGLNVLYRRFCISCGDAPHKVPLRVLLLLDLVGLKRLQSEFH